MRLLFSCLAFFSLWLTPSEAQVTRYDNAFKHWGEYHAPFIDWHWFKAQGLAESNLDQAARSYCGALGVMQLMPATAKDLGVNPFDPEANIQGGIKFDVSLYKMWARIALEQERRDMMFASYNAGPGNLSRAAKLAGDPPRWTTARICLPRVTGTHSAETLQYVLRINRLYQQLQ